MNPYVSDIGIGGLGLLLVIIVIALLFVVYDDDMPED